MPVLLAISAGVVAEGGAGDEIFVAEVGTVELTSSEGSSSGQLGSGVEVGIPVAVAETVELTVSEG